MIITINPEKAAEIDAGSPKQIAKNAIWERASDEEAIAMRSLLDQQPIRWQEIYNGATYISTGHELYSTLCDGLTALFGEERANELLEPTG